MKIVFFIKSRKQFHVLHNIMSTERENLFVVFMPNVGDVCIRIPGS